MFWLYLLDMLSQEVQPSIRCLTEWLIVRVLQRRWSLLDQIWTTLLQVGSSYHLVVVYNIYFINPMILSWNLFFLSKY